MDILNDTFIDLGVYQLKQDKDSIFLCKSVSGNSIGKLMMYNRVSERIFEKSSICYFLNSYTEGDIKELFINRKNYEMLGRVDHNFVLTPNDQYLLCA